MTTLPPIVRSISVPWPRDAAFRRFTQELGAWWPRSTHSIGLDESERVTMEGRVGGRIYETIRGGGECVWGTILAWDPPSRVTFSWHPGQKPEIAQTVEVRFAPADGGTVVELTHSGWERVGKKAASIRRAYGLGWKGVLRIYAGRGWGPYWPLQGLQVVIGGMQRLLGSTAASRAARIS